MSVDAPGAVIRIAFSGRLIAVLVGVVAIMLIPQAPNADAARSRRSPDLAKTYQLKRCPGSVRAMHQLTKYGRYRKLSCARARQIIRIVDNTDGPYREGYFWSTWHGAGPGPRVFGRPFMSRTTRLMAALGSQAESCSRS